MTAPIIGADSRFQAVAAVDRTVVAQAAMEWNRLPIGNLQAGFVDQFLPAVVPGVTAAQNAVARIGATAMADATGASMVINPAAFAGYAPDGTSLVKSLVQPLIETYVNLDNLMPVDQAMASGMSTIDQMLTTIIQDTARAAEQVQLVTDFKIHYWTRVTEPGACDKCILLSGIRYRYDADFQRHRSCRCHSQAKTEDGPVPTPRQLFDSLTTAQQNAAFGPSNAQAIRDGAGVSRVVNATRSRTGMTSVGERFKTTQVNYKGGDPSVPRLVPRSIYQIAQDRQEAIDLLRSHGYIY